MFVPFISNLSSRRLFKRKGGGGGGRGGGGGGGKSSSSGSTGKSSSPSSSKSGSISKGKTTTRSNGYSSPRVIPAGQPFAGRTEGGASRSQIFGSRSATPFLLISEVHLTCIFFIIKKSIRKRLSRFRGTWCRWTWVPILLLANCMASGCYRQRGLSSG